MSAVIVLVTFYSRCGSTEKLALAAAVGAVQARANIRLRRLPDASAPSAAEESKECKENLHRMRKEYVAPTESDVLSADAVIFVAPPNFDTSAAEWTGYLDLLGRMGSEGKLETKVGAALSAGESAQTALSTAILQAGFIVAPPNSAGATPAAAGRATTLGRRVVAVARALKPREQAG